MRIALVIYGSLDTVSGGYLYDRKLVEHLRASGDMVEIVSIPWRGYSRHLLDNASRALAMRLAALNVDLLLQDELNHPSLVWHNLRRPRRAPVISIVHHLRASEQHPAPAAVFYRQVERAYLRGVDGFVFNSQTTRATVEALIGPVARAVVATPAGDRFPRAMPAQQVGPVGPLRLLFVGNVTPRKGLHTLLAALPSGCELDVAGSLTVDSAYARALQARPARSPVRWHGRVSDDALADLFGRTQALVVPSQYEGYGIVYLEAMAFGVPVIASTAGAAREIVTDGVDGLLVPPEDPARLAAAIDTLRDPARRARMRMAARARFEQLPGWEHSCAQIREFLTSMRAPHRGSRQ